MVFDSFGYSSQDFNIFTYCLSIFAKTEEPPSDFISYAFYGHYHDLCVFCDSSVANAKKENTINMRNEFTGENAKVNLCQTCSDCFSMIMIKMENIEQRITDYVMFGRIPQDIADYTKGQFREKECVFCEDPIDDFIATYHSGESAIKIPQGAFNKIYGNAHCCEHCNNAFTKLVLEHHGSEDRIVGVYSDTCTICEDEFPVAKYLYDDRRAANTIGQHVCDQCLYDNGWRDSERESTFSCSCNKTKVDIDLSHESYYDAENTPRCYYCTIDAINDIPIDGKNQVYVHIYRQSETYFFKVFNGGVSVFNSRSTQDGEDSVIKTTIAGCAKALEIVTNKNNSG